MMETTVTLDPIPMVFVEAQDGPRGAREAFHKLEHGLDSLKGRRFYGLISEEGHKYLACVALETDDNPGQLGLLTGVVPGGQYVKTKVEDWSAKLASIADMFQSLREKFLEDESRPRVEFYRSQKELFLFLPVKPGLTD